MVSSARKNEKNLPGIFNSIVASNKIQSIVLKSASVRLGQPFGLSTPRSGGFIGRRLRIWYACKQYRINHKCYVHSIITGDFGNGRVL
jgi:hypothetical protein